MISTLSLIPQNWFTWSSPTGREFHLEYPALSWGFPPLQRRLLLITFQGLQSTCGTGSWSVPPTGFSLVPRLTVSLDQWPLTNVAGVINPQMLRMYSPDPVVFQNDANSWVFSSTTIIRDRIAFRWTLDPSPEPSKSWLLVGAPDPEVS